MLRRSGFGLHPGWQGLPRHVVCLIDHVHGEGAEALHDLGYHGVFNTGGLHRGTHVVQPEPRVFGAELRSIRAAWQLLREAGVNNFVITADRPSVAVAGAI